VVVFNDVTYVLFNYIRVVWHFTCVVCKIACHCSEYFLLTGDDT
jgi:hypothetical protein